MVHGRRVIYYYIKMLESEWESSSPEARLDLAAAVDVALVLHR